MIVSTACRLVLVALAGFGLARAARGEIITVNSTDDRRDADLTDGVCDVDIVESGQQRTLRAAIQHANVTPGADTIVLPPGNYRLTLTGAKEEQAVTGDLDILDELTITGDGSATTIIDGNKGKDRVFDVRSGVVTIEKLTIKRGRARKNETGGGGVRNFGDLTLKKVVFSECRSKTDAGALDQQTGTTTIRDTLFIDNECQVDGGAIDLDGGSMDVFDSAFVRNHALLEGGACEDSGQVVSFTNVTFSENSATEGGALSLEDGGTLSLLGCTLAENSALKGAGISTIDQVQLVNHATAQNTIFADNKKKECHGKLTSNGGNLDIGTSCKFGAGDLSGVDPLLDLLDDYGGFTPTYALLPDSPAIDRGNDTDCPDEDQRGLPRVNKVGIGSAICDIGAFEVQ